MRGEATTGEVKLYSLTLVLREGSSSTLLGFKSRWRRGGERLWRKLIPRATWWDIRRTRGQRGLSRRRF